MIPTAEQQQVEQLGFVQVLGQARPELVVHVRGVMQGVDRGDEESFALGLPALVPGIAVCQRGDLGRSQPHAAREHRRMDTPLETPHRDGIVS